MPWMSDLFFNVPLLHCVPLVQPQFSCPGSTATGAGKTFGSASR